MQIQNRNYKSLFKTDGRTERDCDVSGVETVFTAGTLTNTVAGGAHQHIPLQTCLNCKCLQQLKPTPFRPLVLKIKSQELKNSVKIAEVFYVDEGFKFYQCNQYNQIHNQNLINNHFQAHSSCNFLNVFN